MPIDFDAVPKFGEIDADADPILEQAFEDHEAYIQARSHAKFLILGRKGSGKTAIYRRILGEKSEDIFSIGYAFSDYPWHHHTRQKQIGVPEEHCYINSWEYLIYITLAKILLNSDKSQPWCDATLTNIATIENFVTDTYGSRDPDMSRIFAPQTEIKLKGELGVNLKVISGKLFAESVPMPQFPVIVQEVNKVLSELILTSLNTEKSYYVCFDELDLGLSLEGVDYQSRLIGLLLAAKKINNKARHLNKSCSVLVFLRDDIYDMLHFEDKNKMTEGASCVIQWDVARNGPSLKSLMEKRFFATLGIPQTGAWESVFDEQERMTNKQTKYAHILDRTFLRPRDIIKFCNEILITHRARSERTTRFSNKDIIDARQSYSRYLLNELDDEIKKYEPDYKKYLEVLKTVGSLQFEMSDVEEAVESRRDLIGTEISAKAMLASLFDFAVIGYYRPGGGGFGGSDYVWKHKERQALFNEGASSYRIHSGFMEVLGVKKFTRSSD